MTGRVHTPDELDGLLAHLAQAAVPADVLERARLLFLDTVGCAIAGLRAPAVRACVEAAARLEPGTVALPLARIADAPPGAGSVAELASISASPASMALAMAACWDEACEGLAVAHGRPGVPVVAAVLAVGLARASTVGDVLRALITGYEVGGRMGARLRIKPGMHVDAGWPALGVAAAVAQLLGGDAECQRDAIELAACQLPFGLYLPIIQGADGRNTYLGHAALLGVQCALAASAGVRAPRGALRQHVELALGLDEAEWTTAAAAIPPGTWLLREGYLKRWPAVKHVHYGIAAVRGLLDGLRSAGSLTDLAWTAGISRIVLRTYPEAVTYCGNRAPAAPIQAQFSLSFGVAAALRFGDLAIEAYRDPAFHEPLLRRLEQLVELRPEAALGHAGRRAVVLELEGADGVRHEHAVEEVDGDPGRPLGPQAVREKFHRLAAPTLGDSFAAQQAERWLRAPDTLALRAWWDFTGTTGR